MIKEYFTLVGVGQYITLAYSKEENVIVERYNKEINQQLRALTFGDVSLDDNRNSSHFVQRILISNNSDRLKISASKK